MVAERARASHARSAVRNAPDSTELTSQIADMIAPIVAPAHATRREARTPRESALRTRRLSGSEIDERGERDCE